MKDEKGTRKKSNARGLFSSFIAHPSSLPFHPSSLILHPCRFILHPSSFILLRGGFTLLEVLISLALTGGLLVTLIYTLNYHLGLVERQEAVTAATLLAKNKIAEIEQNPESGKGFFEAPYDSYSFETFVKDSPYAGIYEIVVVVKADGEEVKLNEFIFK